VSEYETNEIIIALAAQMGPSRFRLSNAHTCKETPRLQKKNKSETKKKKAQK
jgi:hypothetical protein